MTDLWTPEPRFTPHRERSDQTRNGDGAESPAWSKVNLTDLMDRYDLVEVTDNAVVVSERNFGVRSLADITDDPNMSELAIMNGPSSYYSLARTDYNPRLRGKLGMRVYDEMRKSNARIHMALTLRKIPVLAGRWYIEPASKSKKDKKIAEYVWKNLTMQLSDSWPVLLQESLLHLDFGWYAFEEVYDKGPDGLIKWKKFIPLHPLDVTGWDYDIGGGPNGVFWPTSPYSGETKLIPITKMIAFTNQKEAGNMEGVSALRPMYMHWFFINNFYKIDAIQKERHGVGIPVIVLPPGYNSTDKLKANEMGRNLRSNEKAHIVLPPMWDIHMLELQGHQVDIIQSVDHHNEMIANAVLAPMGAGKGNKEDASVLADLYMKATRITSDVVRDAFNKWSIPRLVKWNWGQTASENPPQLKVRRIGETVDWRTISFTLRNLVGADLIIPDEPLLDSIRTEFDLPEADPATAFAVIAPQGIAAPPTADQPGENNKVPKIGKGQTPNTSVAPNTQIQAPNLPRQSRASNMKNTPSKGAGRDGSGKAQGN